jgi:dimethylargininase
MSLIAVVHPVSAALADCELSFVDRTPIDLGLAHRQHRSYCEALVGLGCDLIELPAQDDMADAVFVEDTALVLDEVAVMTRPGAASRRAEGASVAAVLQRYRPLLAIEAPGTLDGGDVLRLGRRVFVGRSARSNVDGIAQLQQLLGAFGYSVEPLPTRSCLHLKSAVTEVSDGVLLLNADWVDAGAFAGYRLIEVDPTEPRAANALRVGGGVIYPDCFPHTLARLREEGIEVTALALSELRKAEGAVTCCSLVFRR